MVSEVLDSREDSVKMRASFFKNEEDSNKEEEDLEILEISEIPMTTVSRDEMVSNNDFEQVLLQEIQN